MHICIYLYPSISVAYTLVLTPQASKRHPPTCPNTHKEHKPKPKHTHTHTHTYIHTYIHTQFYVVEMDFEFRVVLPATEDTQTSCPFPAVFITGTALRAHSQVPLTFTVCVYVCVYVCV